MRVLGPAILYLGPFLARRFAPVEPIHDRQETRRDLSFSWGLTNFRAARSGSSFLLGLYSSRDVELGPRMPKHRLDGLLGRVRIALLPTSILFTLQLMSLSSIEWNRDPYSYSLATGLIVASLPILVASWSLETIVQGTAVKSARHDIVVRFLTFGGVVISLAGIQFVFTIAFNHVIAVFFLASLALAGSTTAWLFHGATREARRRVTQLRDEASQMEEEIARLREETVQYEEETRSIRRQIAQTRNSDPQHDPQPPGAGSGK